MDADQTFYPERAPAEALAAYRQSLDNLYDRTRALVTRRFLRKHLSLDALDVLEVGCGGGAWSVYFAAEAASLACCDLRPHLVEAAKLNVARGVPRERAARVRWFGGDAAALHCDRRFDFVFLKDVIEHVEDDAAFLRHLAAQLRPRGRLYLSTQNSFSLNYLIEGAYLRLRGNRNWRGWDVTHLRFYTPGRLKRLAAACGLRPVAWHSVYQWPHRFLTRLIFRRIIERPALYLPDRLCHACWPLSRTGWALGVMLERTAHSETTR